MDSDRASFRPVEDWLRSLGLICFAQSFYDNGYEDLDICKEIAEGDLDEIGVKTIKDRNDILAAVIRLNQKNIYFELEPDELETTEVVIRKLDPFVLKTRVKAELEDDNIQLTQPPYFYPDGSLGSLQSLAETLSFKLETFLDDVLPALEQLRRRQLPTGVYNDVAQMMEDQRQQEVKHRPNVHFRDQPRDEPEGYLNVEVPYRRSTSLSKHDKRITKSTTNLAEAILDPKGIKKDQKKRKTVAKSHSVYDKHSRGLLAGFSIRKRGASGGHTVKNDSIPLAKDITMNQKDLMELMTKVKHGELSQDTVLDEVQQHYRQSMAVDDLTPLSPIHRSTALSKKDKKKLEKEKKKRKQKAERKLSSKHGHSLFYTSESTDPAGHLNSLSNIISNDQAEDMLILGHSSGSDISRESPDLRMTFGNKLLINKPTNSQASASQDSLDSSTGSISSGTGSVVSTESHDTGGKSRSNSVRSVTKPNKAPPTIPTRDDHQLNETKQHSALIPKRNSLKSSLSAPPLKATIPIAPPRHSSDPKKKMPKTTMTSSKSFDHGPTYSVTNENNAVVLTLNEQPKDSVSSSNDAKPSDEKLFQVKSFPFAGKDLDEIKRKSDDIKRRSYNGVTTNAIPKMPISISKSASPRLPPKPPKRSDIAKEKPVVEKNSPVCFPNEIEREVNHNEIPKPTLSEPKQSQAKKESGDLPVRDSPKPSPRPTSYNSIAEHEIKQTDLTESSKAVGKTEPRPYVPPRKHRSVSLTHSNPLLDNTDFSTSKTFPVAEKDSVNNPDGVLETVNNKVVHDTAAAPVKPFKPKPIIPRRDLSSVQKPTPAGGDHIKLERFGQSGDACNTSHAKANVISSDRNVHITSKQNVDTDQLAVCKKNNISAHDELKHDSLSDKKANHASVQMKGQDASTSVQRIKLKIKNKSLKDLVRRKCSLENVDLTEYPYTNQDGAWGVPFPLISRYAEELRRSVEEIVKYMDELRTEALVKDGKQTQHCDVRKVLEILDTEIVTSSVSEWLMSIGLPMFKEDFAEIGLQRLKELKSLSPSDVNSAGVYEMRHIEQLFDRLKQI